jgi:hypothetical protein
MPSTKFLNILSIDLSCETHLFNIFNFFNWKREKKRLLVLCNGNSSSLEFFYIKWEEVCDKRKILNCK